MQVSCMHYTNNARLAAGIKTFCVEPGFRFLCLDGTVTKMKDQFNVITPVVTVLVTFISKKNQKSYGVVLTSDSQYKNMTGTVVDLETFAHKRTHYALCCLLAEKYRNTSNRYTIEFSGVGESVIVTPAPADVQADFNCILKGTTGEALVTGADAIQRVLSTCQEVKSFEYCTITPDVEKVVTVRKSRGEIYREIAHYLNRTIALASTLDGQILEQYISATAVLEVYTKPDGTRYYKRISPIVMRSSQPFCIYLTNASVEDIAREQGRNLKRS